MANLNRVTVMGVLGRDPKTKYFPNGGSITSFSIATTEYWEDILQANKNRLQSGTESPPVTD